ncbi:MAG: hypothetical protein COA42_05555 [Alteromonadaceae bacterium]|nr:MAG: hypothetical protein COA42_05555 [Alteromonadaceae bacterium]
MKLAIVALIGVLSANSLFASEVGAPYPQYASSVTANFALSIVEAGASSSSAIQAQEKEASHLQIELFNSGAEGLGAKISRELEAKMAEKMSRIFDQ